MQVKVGMDYIEQYDEWLSPDIEEMLAEETKQGQIVFYGPSYFTRWRHTEYSDKNMSDSILGKSGAKCVINRGFGSSCAEHQLYYYPTPIRPLAPKVLVYESLANGSSFGYTPEESFALASRVVAYAKTDFPDIHIYLCGPHPSLNPSEEALKIRATYEKLLKELVAETDNCFYIDVSGNPGMQRKDIYVEDGGHFNHIGYKCYAELFKEALKEELAQY